MESAAVAGRGLDLTAPSIAVVLALRSGADCVELVRDDASSDLRALSLDWDLQCWKEEEQKKMSKIQVKRSAHTDRHSQVYSASIKRMHVQREAIQAQTSSTRKDRAFDTEGSTIKQRE